MSATIPITRATERPHGATGVHWTRPDYTECLAVVAFDAIGDCQGADTQGEFVFDASLTGGDDCGCDSHAEMRRDTTDTTEENQR